MYLANWGIIPPKEWIHNPNLQNEYGKTVAMKLAYHGIIPPEEWFHDPNLRDKNERTVSDRF